jgi:hypothetical protein
MNKQKILIFSLSAMLFFSLSFIAYSWNEPTTNMPSGYTAPLNTSSTAQTKIGAITVPMVYDYNNTSYYIDPSGNSLFAGKIGIGTTAPVYNLDVNGTIRARDFSAAGGKNLIIGDDTYLTDIDQANMLGIYGMQNTDRAGVKFGSSGNYVFGINNRIGVGTTNPQAPLDVNGNIITSRPSDTNHAATKGYVDEQIAAVRAIISGAQPLVNGVHTQDECKNAGGEVVDSDVTFKLCRFNGSSCPSGWTSYKSFTTTQSMTGGDGDCTICTTGYHNWGNSGTETCTYQTGCPWVTCSCTGTLYAKIIQIGCY